MQTDIPTEGPLPVPPDASVAAIPAAAHAVVEAASPKAQQAWQEAEMSRTFGALARVNQAALPSLFFQPQQLMISLLDAKTLPDLFAVQWSWMTGSVSQWMDYWQRVAGIFWTTESSYVHDALAPLDKAVSETPEGNVAAAGEAMRAAADPFNLWMAPFNAAWNAGTAGLRQMH